MKNLFNKQAELEALRTQVIGLIASDKIIGEQVAEIVKASHIK